MEIPTANFLKSVNYYLVEKDGNLFLIDAGYNQDPHWDFLLQTLHKQGKDLKDIHAILLTHNHIDHVGLVHRISKQTDIPVYIHPYALPKLKGDPEFVYDSYLFFKNIYEKMDTGDYGRGQIEARYQRQMNNQDSALNWNVQAIEQSEIFGFEVIGIPGHAPDQVGFYLSDKEIIFVGDLLIEHLRTNAFVEPSLDGTWIPALEQHIDSLKKIIDLKPKIAFSGHGKMIDDPAKLARRRLNAIESKMNSFLSLIEQGISTGREIVLKRHADKYDKIFSTLISDTLSFLDYMESIGMIERQEIDGIWKWRVT